MLWPSSLTVAVSVVAVSAPSPRSDSSETTCPEMLAFLIALTPTKGWPPTYAIWVRLPSRRVSFCVRKSDQRRESPGVTVLGRVTTQLPATTAVGAAGVVGPEEPRASCGAAGVGDVGATGASD